MAVPFFGAEGQIAGGFGFFIPEFRFPKVSLKKRVAALNEAASGLSMQLGGST